MSEMSRAEAIFFAALNRSPSERANFLDEACAGNAGLRDRIERMLAAQPHLGNFLNQGQPPPKSQLERTKTYEPPEEVVGSVIDGKYKLLQVIGEGGMGSIFMADQTHPVKRRVAVKVIKAGMDSARVLARFEAERQALALMDHPNIARVLDAGTTETGRPFFVMELVKGIPLTQFCDEHKLPVRDRLNLFMQVCSAVQHAHQKGIIHRDLKPGNILVESHDGKPVPKAIDFGLAKATSGIQLTEHTLFTALGHVAGTPLYMAPEQAAFNAIDVDTRADVYALGVILYELLTGTTPIERETFKKAAFDELLRVIREQEPPAPSSRISSSETKANVAALRQMEPAKLGRFVRGDLDWIVMKALSKERERRYESAMALAKDVERFLMHEPVQAGPPGTGYKLRKFVRRNRPQVLAVGMMLIALVAGMSGITFGFIRAEWARMAEAEQRTIAEQKQRQAELSAQSEAEQRAIAEQREREATEAERLAVQREQAEKKAREQAEEVSVFMRQVFAQGSAQGQASKTREVNRTLTVKEAMDFASKAIEGKFADRPEIEAALRGTIGNTYRELSEFSAAEPHLKVALERLENALGPDHPATLDSMTNLAWLYHDTGDYTAAELLLKRTLAGFEKALGADHVQTLASVNNLAELYCQKGDYGLAEPLLKRALAGFENALGADHADTLMAVSNLALLYHNLGDFVAAEQLYQRALEGRENSLGESHPDTLVSLNNLAMLHETKGEYAAAEPLLKRALAGTEKAFGADHSETLMSVYNLAHLYHKSGNCAAADPLYLRASAGFERVLGADNFLTLTALGNLGVSYKDAGRLDEAIPLLEKAYKSNRNYPTLAGIDEQLLDAYAKAGKRSEAAQLVTDRLIEKRAVLEPGSPELGTLLVSTGKKLLEFDPTAAEAVLRECVAIREKLAGTAWNTANAKSLLGASLLLQKKYADAEPLLVAGYEGLKADEPAISPQTKSNIADAVKRLIDLYDATGRPDEATKWRKVLEQEEAPRHRAGS